MSYLPELVVKFPIEWYSQLEMLDFDHFLQNLMINPL